MDEKLQGLVHGDHIMRRNGRAHRQQPQDFKLKFDILHFDSRMHTEEYLDWLKSVETFFECMDILEEKKVKLAIYKLQSGATAWWEQL